MFFDFVIEKKTNPSPSQEFPNRTLEKFNIPVLTMDRHQNCISRATFVQRELPLEYSHRNHHLLYTCHIEQLSIGYVRSTQILCMSSLVRHSSHFCSKFTTERLIEFYHCRLESSPFCERGKRDRASAPVKE